MGIHMRNTNIRMWKRDRGRFGTEARVFFTFIFQPLNAWYLSAVLSVCLRKFLWEEIYREENFALFI